MSRRAQRSNRIGTISPLTGSSVGGGSLSKASLDFISESRKRELKERIAERFISMGWISVDDPSTKLKFYETTDVTEKGGLSNDDWILTIIPLTDAVCSQMLFELSKIGDPKKGGLFRIDTLNIQHEDIHYIGHSVKTVTVILGWKYTPGSDVDDVLLYEKQRPLSVPKSSLNVTLGIRTPKKRTGSIERQIRTPDGAEIDIEHQIEIKRGYTSPVNPNRTPDALRELRSIVYTPLTPTPRNFVSFYTPSGLSVTPIRVDMSSSDRLKVGSSSIQESRTFIDTKKSPPAQLPDSTQVLTESLNDEEFLNPRITEKGRQESMSRFLATALNLFPPQFDVSDAHYELENTMRLINNTNVQVADYVSERIKSVYSGLPDGIYGEVNDFPLLNYLMVMAIAGSWTKYTSTWNIVQAKWEKPGKSSPNYITYPDDVILAQNLLKVFNPEGYMFSSKQVAEWGAQWNNLMDAVRSLDTFGIPQSKVKALATDPIAVDAETRLSWLKLETYANALNELREVKTRKQKKASPRKGARTSLSEYRRAWRGLVNAISKKQEGETLISSKPNRLDEGVAWSALETGFSNSEALRAYILRHFNNVWQVRDSDVEHRTHVDFFLAHIIMYLVLSGSDKTELPAFSKIAAFDVNQNDVAFNSALDAMGNLNLIVYPKSTDISLANRAELNQLAHRNLITFAPVLGFLTNVYVTLTTTILSCEFKFKVAASCLSYAREQAFNEWRYLKSLSDDGITISQQILRSATALLYFFNQYQMLLSITNALFSDYLVLFNMWRVLQNTRRSCMTMEYGTKVDTFLNTIGNGMSAVTSMTPQGLFRALCSAGTQLTDDAVYVLYNESVEDFQESMAYVNQRLLDIWGVISNVVEEQTIDIASITTTIDLQAYIQNRPANLEAVIENAKRFARGRLDVISKSPSFLSGYGEYDDYMQTFLGLASDEE